MALIFVKLIVFERVMKCVDVKPLISAVYSFNKALEALEKAKEKGILKVLLNKISLRKFNPQFNWGFAKVRLFC